MRFADIPGNTALKQALVGMADSGRVHHAMLFYENDGGGAFPLALAYLQYLECRNRHDGDSCGECPSCNRISKLIHPDVHIVFPVAGGSKSSLASKDIVSDTYMQYFRELALENPYFLENELSSAIGIEGKSASIAAQEARSIVDTLSLSSVENGWKSIVCLYPEKMNQTAANKLLKLVEEPPERTLFLFITHNPDKVMPTIFSRCQNSRVLPLSREEVSEALVCGFGTDREKALQAAEYSGGSIGVALARIRSNEDDEEYGSIFSLLMNSILSRNLSAALDASEQMASLSSREKQKAFCKFASERLRDLFFLQKGIAGFARTDELLQSWARGLRPDFCMKAFTCLDNAAMLIDRNVNQKMIFCDLVDRFFVYA